MNGLRYIAFIIIVSLIIPLFGQDCTDGTTLMEKLLDSHPENICVPDEFIAIEQSQVQAGYFFTNVTLNGSPVDDDDWVGAFYGSICVGVRLWDTTQCGGGTCEVVIMGYDGTVDTDGYCNIGDAVTFKIYDASDNIYHDATPSEDIPWSINGYNLIDHLIAENLHTNTGLLFPDNYTISNIYPNPFNPVTNIDYSISENAAIKLVVYNIHGRQIQTLVQGLQTAGYHSINWNASNYPSGVYFIQLDGGEFSQTQRVVLIK